MKRRAIARVDFAPGADHDVVILGGGPAGGAAAIALARAGFSVTLLQRTRHEWSHIGETLPPAVRAPLTQLGIWAAFNTEAYAPAPGIEGLWGDENSLENDRLFSPSGPGWFLDRSRFNGLLASVARAAGAHLGLGVTVHACERLGDERWRLHAIQENRPLELYGSWLIDASGRAAWLAQREGAQRITDDRLIGVVGFGRALKPDEPRTRVEARPSGWWFSVPLPEGRAMAAYMTDSDLLSSGKDDLARFWADQLRESRLTRARFAPHDQRTSMRLVAANGSRLDRVAGKGWLAIGAAAATYDPLSLQGIPRALQSGLAAAETLAAHRDGDDNAISRFASQAEADFQEYRRSYAAFYARERRWAGCVFWQRRHRLAQMSFTYNWKDLQRTPAGSQNAGRVPARASR
jgi:flavin-dependent dehydrogenase